MRNGKKVNRTKRERGRPQRLDESALAQIEEMALSGLSPLQMGSVLKCSRRAIETFLDSHEDLKAKIQCYRKNSTALAKLILHRQLEGGDPEAAKWLLEREAKQKLERERAALLRQQRRVLERAENPEQAPTGLMSEYWQRVSDYFTHRDDPKPEQTTEASDKDGDQTDKTDD